jgi:hypothetical protein
VERRGTTSSDFNQDSRAVLNCSWFVCVHTIHLRWTCWFDPCRRSKTSLSNGGDCQEQTSRRSVCLRNHCPLLFCCWFRWPFHEDNTSTISRATLHFSASSWKKRETSRAFPFSYLSYSAIQSPRHFPRTLAIRNPFSNQSDPLIEQALSRASYSYVVEPLTLDALDVQYT